VTNTFATSILGDLAVVEGERSRRAADRALGATVVALKAYQHRRFEKTYADLLASAEFGPASRFFLDELYGPRDFTRRDEQFARVVPSVVRLFGREVGDTVATLAALHALSESLDTRMATILANPQIDAPAYVAAWQAAAAPAERERQIALTIDVGRDLDRLTRKAWLRHSLRLMRGPARAAGLGALQAFLESGFDTFSAMTDAPRFLALIGDRERRLARALFEHPPGAPLVAAGTLAQLP
jgi:hypothetical protein